MNLYVPTAREARKFLVALGTVIAALVANGFLEGDLRTWALAGLAALNALGVYQVPNFSAPVHDDFELADPAEVGLDFDPDGYEPQHKAEPEVSSTS